MALLKSFGSDSADDHGIHNRIVARVQLRVGMHHSSCFHLGLHADRSRSALEAKIFQTEQALPS